MAWYGITRKCFYLAEQVRQCFRKFIYITLRRQWIGKTTLPAVSRRQKGRCCQRTHESPPRRRRRSSYRSARSPPVSHKRKSRAKGQGSTGKPTNGQYASSANFILSSGNCVRRPVLLPGGDSDFPVFLYYNRYFCKYLQYSVNFNPSEAKDCRFAAVADCRPKQGLSSV